MLINPEEIRAAKEALGDRNADLIAEVMEIERYNESRRVGCCPNPAHDDRNPSCSYNPKTHSFHCFSCGFSVDLIEAYIMKLGCTFVDACEKLFEEAGIQYDFTEKGIKSSRYKYPNPQYDYKKDAVYAYWANRHISPETIDYLGIEQDLQGNTLFRYFDLNDVFVMCKVRKSQAIKKGENKCWHLPGADTSHILYNINKINVTQPLIITCGEGDCAAAIECGFYNTVSIPMGDGNTQWIAECWEWLQQFDEIILIHDNDKAGQKFSKEVSTRLGEYRTKIVDIPLYHEKVDGTRIKIKDLNELLYYEGKEAVRHVINDAKESEIPTIVDYTDIAKFDMSDVDGFTTGFADMDRAIGKMYVGTTTLLTGIAGSGKSSLLSTLACQSIQQGFPVFIYSGELSNQSLKNWIDSVHAGQRGINEYQSPNSTYYKIRQDVYDKINQFYKGQMFFYRDGFEHKTSRLFATMETLVRRRGVRTLILDNMSSVDLENDDNNKYAKQDQFIRDLIEFSKKWQVVCIVVLHPKKMDMVRKMSLMDLSGVTSCVNLSHRVMALYRVQPKDKQGVVGRNGKYTTPPIKYDVLLEVLKDRFGSAANQTFGLYYDKPSKRFFTNYQNLDWQYGWDDEDHAGQPLPYGAPQLEEEEEVYGHRLAGGRL